MGGESEFVLKTSIKSDRVYINISFMQRGLMAKNEKFEKETK